MPDKNALPAGEGPNSQLLRLSSSDSLMSDPFSPPADDDNYNPLWANDVYLPDRGSKFERAWYFWDKHGSELMNAAVSYVTSHFEFGGCLADYQGLRKRYAAIRSLEDIDDQHPPRDSSGRVVRRVRLVNYYSASTGRIKQPSGQSQLSPDAALDQKTGAPRVSLGQTPRASHESSRSSLGEAARRSTSRDPAQPGELELHGAVEGMRVSTASNISPPPTSPQQTPRAEPNSPGGGDQANTSPLPPGNEMPPIPPMPTAPPAFDPSKYQDKDVLKLARKDHDRQVKLYEQAKKNREKAIRAQEKLTKKRERQALKEDGKQQELQKRQTEVEEKEDLKRATTLNPEAYDKQLRHDAAAQAASPDQPRKYQRDRKFCMLPQKDKITGLRDPVWVRVFMEGVDEVEAHTTLFEMSETYSQLVGDTAARIAQWLRGAAVGTDFSSTPPSQALEGAS